MEVTEEAEMAALEYLPILVDLVEGGALPKER